VGTGAHRPEGPFPVDPPTGEMPSRAAAAFGACVVEVEVDRETGRVSVLKTYHAYEVGRAISPLICQGQINANARIPAITAAIHDALGVWITEFPTTPEMILKALETKRGKLFLFIHLGILPQLS
jgi:CO/xanthine dehydrogenase Mo-binding subunit